MTISKHGFTEDLGSRLLDSLGREEGKGLGCRDRRYTMPFEANLLHGIDFFGGLDEVLLGVEGSLVGDTGYIK